MSVKLAEIDVTVARKHVKLPQMMLKGVEINVTIAQRNVKASEGRLRVFENGVTVARGSVTPSKEARTFIGNILPEPANATIGTRIRLTPSAKAICSRFA